MSLVSFRNGLYGALCGAGSLGTEDAQHSVKIFLMISFGQLDLGWSRFPRAASGVVLGNVLLSTDVSCEGLYP